MTGRFSWSLACLKDLENGNESAVKSVEEDDDGVETVSELVNPSSAAVSS